MMDRMQWHRDGIIRSTYSMPVPFLSVQSSPQETQPLSTLLNTIRCKRFYYLQNFKKKLLEIISSALNAQLTPL